MTLNVSSAGQILMLKYILNNAAPGNLTLRLYKNTVTLGDATVIGDFVESSAASYARVTLTGSDWTVAFSSTGVATQTAKTFTYITSEFLMGYYVCTISSPEALWAEQFSSSISIGGGGGTVVIAPRITLRDET